MLWIPEGAARGGIGGRGEAVFDPVRGRVDVLAPMEAAVLSGCRGTGTLDEMAARVAAAGVPATRAAIVGVLAGLVKRGVIATEAEMARLLAGDAPGGATIEALGLPTRDRPRSLERALRSHAEDLAAAGRRVEVLVVDSSTDPRNEAEGRAIAEDVARRTSVPVRFAARAERIAFAQALAEESGVPLALVRRALGCDAAGEFAAGAARNVLLLDAVGRASLQVDDDTRCDLRRAPGATDALRVRSFEDPTDLWFDAATIEGGEPARGYAAVHERLLGKRAGSMAAAALGEGRADVEGAGAALLAKMAAGARIAVTQLGIRGDSGMGSMAYLLTIGDASRARLVASEAIYRRAMTTRRLARAATAPTVTEQELCMTLAIGLDGRRALPPFPPLHRNEDGLFGAVLAACDPGALFGHLPWTIAHEPEEARPSDVDAAIDQAATVGANDLVAGLVGASRADVDVRSPERAFESLGRALVAWGRVPEDELFERLSWMLARRLAQRLARIDRVLRETRREPLFWARDVERLADTIRERVEEPERAVPVELVASAGLARARGAAIEIAREYGELLAAWPALLDAARSLRARGARVGEVTA